LALGNLARHYGEQGRYADAEHLFERSLMIREKALGANHPDVAASLSNLAVLYGRQGRYADAEPLHKRSLLIWEKALGPNHPHVANSLNNLAALYREQDHYADAEPLYRRSLSIREHALGTGHPDVAASLSNLAELYVAQGRGADAAPLYKRSLSIRERALGTNHPEVATSLSNLAELFRAQGQHVDAMFLHQRSLSIRERVLGADHPDLAASLNNLALLYNREGRYTDAEPLLKRSLSIWEKALGGHHPRVAVSLNNLGTLYAAQGRYAEAEALHKRSLTIQEVALGPEHLDVAISLSNLAILHFAQRQWAKAVDHWRQSTELVIRRVSRGADIVTKTLPGLVTSDVQREGYLFRGLVKAAYQIAMEGRARGADLAAETLIATQWSQGSEAAASLAQMAARSAAGLPQLAGVVRERQDLVSEWRVKDKLLFAAKSEPPAKRKVEAEKALADRLAAIDTRLAEISRRLAQDFPDYAALASPSPTSVADVQGQLGPDEALVLFLDTPEWKPLAEESFIWVVTKTDIRWVRSDLGTAALGREVMALRCGLDATAWDGGGKERCAKALGIPLDKAPGTDDPLPFSHARAHKLYAALFGEVQDLIKGKHLLIVPSGPLTQLPFHALVTRPPTSSDHRVASWLARAHAISILPAVSSLKALRRVGRPSTALRPMIGIGNPLLTGYPGRPDDDDKKKALAKDHAQWAALALAKQRCPETPRQRVAGQHSSKSGRAARVETRGATVNVAHIKAQVPLPETADELCAVAQGVKAEPRDIHLGSRATEREVKRLSDTGDLAKYRMVHFATHGTLAGELTGTHEPGLILTPPDTASEADDGYLSASEIAALKLDADWVVLSACNTAAGGATNAEALSGLGRAFVYAGARSLLVSHWAVYSEATVKLITGAVSEMSRHPKVGRSEAMRRSMLALIDKGSKEEAHPAFWAPFVVVGEGAAGR
jgi:CHAT domain-containing protein/tetratricopeptide (TPR) repeat protein